MKHLRKIGLMLMTLAMLMGLAHSLVPHVHGQPAQETTTGSPQTLSFHTDLGVLDALSHSFVQVEHPYMHTYSDTERNSATAKSVQLLVLFAVVAVVQQLATQPRQRGFAHVATAQLPPSPWFGGHSQRGPPFV